jgi:hypothetical protein
VPESKRKAQGGKRIYGSLRPAPCALRFAFAGRLWETPRFESIDMLRPQMNQDPGKRGPGLFEATLGALVGAATGGVFGLFAVGIYPAMVTRDLTWFFKTPSLNLISCLVCVPVGWLLGWLLGPPLGKRFNSPKVEIAAGVVAGLVPVGVIIVLVAARA